MCSSIPLYGSEQLYPHGLKFSFFIHLPSQGSAYNLPIQYRYVFLFYADMDAVESLMTKHPASWLGVNPENIDKAIVRFPNHKYWYIETEINLSALGVQGYFNGFLNHYIDLINRLPIGSEVLWSPFVNELGNDQQVRLDYSRWLTKIKKMTKKGKYHFVSALQDMVGLRPEEYIGTRDNFESQDHLMNILSIRGHYLACLENDVEPRVNIEMFQWNLAQGGWEYASEDRIKKQIRNEWIYSITEIGPNWAMGNGMVRPPDYKF